MTSSPHSSHSIKYSGILFAVKLPVRPELFTSLTLISPASIFSLNKQLSHTTLMDHARRTFIGDHPLCTVNCIIYEYYDMSSICKTEDFWNRGIRAYLRCRSKAQEVIYLWSQVFFLTEKFRDRALKELRFSNAPAACPVRHSCGPRQNRTAVSTMRMSCHTTRP